MILTKDYFRYFIGLIKVFYKKNNNLTYENFLKIQTFIEKIYKLDNKRIKKEQDEFIKKFYKEQKE